MVNILDLMNKVQIYEKSHYQATEIYLSCDIEPSRSMGIVCMSRRVFFQTCGFLSRQGRTIPRGWSDAFDFFGVTANWMYLRNKIYKLHKKISLEIFQ